MAAEAEDEAQMIKLSPYTDWILRRSTVNGQVEEDELTKQTRQSSRKEVTRMVGWMEFKYFREDGGVISLYALFLFSSLFMYLFIFGCVGSSFLCEGFL